MDDDIIRIVISTDNHLGFMQKDPVRGNDSFASFEEVLSSAKEMHADFLLLAGDLFHENKPSRKTTHATLDLIRKYCTGEDPVYMEIINDQEEIFRHCGHKTVNYEDPYQAISLPIMAIHGNHDDPSREGVGNALAALDLLSVTNLVNYIGKYDQVDDIAITPVLIRKGATMIALYALGAVRDERLNRMWSQKNVKFLRPTEEQGRARFLNIFVLHQNRDYGRGKKNCIHESMIPDWMDVVIWGNEHECIPELVESLVGTFRIYQPGSSVATSYSESESSLFPKHFGVLEVHEQKFRLVAKPYSQIRQFIYEDIVLSDVEGLQARDLQVEDRVQEVLAAKVKSMIRVARGNLIPNDGGSCEASYALTDPHKVIVRLRVFHSGFPTINQQRFGTQFVGDVANPSDMLLFSKKSKDGPVGGATGRGAERYQSEFDALSLSGDMEALSRIRVEDLVQEALGSQNKQLGLLEAAELSTALEDFVIRRNPNAISDVVEKSLHTTKKRLAADVSGLQSKDDILAKLRDDRSSQIAASRERTGASTFSSSGIDRGADDMVSSADIDVLPAQSAKAKRTATGAAKKKQPAAATSSSRGSKKTAVAGTAGPTGRTKRAAAKKGTYAEPSSDEDAEAEDDESSAVPSDDGDEDYDNVGGSAEELVDSENDGDYTTERKRGSTASFKKKGSGTVAKGKPVAGGRAREGAAGTNKPASGKATKRGTVAVSAVDLGSNARKKAATSNRKVREESEEEDVIQDSDDDMEVVAGTNRAATAPLASKRGGGLDTFVSRTPASARSSKRGGSTNGGAGQSTGSQVSSSAKQNVIDLSGW